NEYTVSANNATHRLAAAFTGNIPIGRGLLIGSTMTRVAAAVIVGWSASSNITLQTGQPVHIQMSRARLSGGRQRPNLTCATPGTGVSFKDAAAALLNGSSDPSVISVFNSSCFADPGDQQPGSTPRYFEDLNSQGIE